MHYYANERLVDAPRPDLGILLLLLLIIQTRNVKIIMGDSKRTRANKNITTSGGTVMICVREVNRGCTASLNAVSVSRVPERPQKGLQHYNIV